MIHYHGGPLGGKAGQRGAFWAGRHGFVSYYRPDDIEVIAECCQSFAIDNGAFSFWRSDEPYNFDGYYEFCDQWGRLPTCDWCLIPDVIDGGEAENDRLIVEWPKHIRGVPVYHLHEDTERAAWLSREWPYLAIGSSGEWPNPGNESWHRRMGEVMAVVCDDGAPRCRLHGLRMLSPEIYTAYPFASADSTNAVQNKSRLNITNAALAASVIADRIEAHQSATRWKADRQCLIPFALTNR